MSFGVLKTALLQTWVLLVVTLHCWASGSTCAEGSYCVHLQGQAVQERLSRRKKTCL